MNKLFKLTFTPLFDSIDNINKYKVSVEYFDKNLVNTVFDVRDSKGVRVAAFFRRHTIDVINHYLEGCGGESFTSKSLPDGSCLIEQRYIQPYVNSIESLKPQLEEWCKKKQKEEELTEKAWDNWLQEKPIEFSL